MVTFTYPYVTPTITVQVPNPNLGDAQQDEHGASFGIAMSARVYSYISTPTRRRLLLTFSKLNLTKMTDLKNLIYHSASGEIGYLDHESRQWRGHVMNDPFEDQAGKNFQVITLEFEGSIV
jgi:hypothetical protein